MKKYIEDTMNKVIKLDESTDEFKKIKEEWSDEASKQTLETLPEFLRKITEDFQHDYGTICHAISISSIATANAINKSDQGGITGFQAGAVMWEFIREFNHKSNKCGLSLIDYDNFLYPQYAHQYNKSMSKEIFCAIQNQAIEYLKEESENCNKYVSEKVVSHWESIVDGVVPFGYSINE